MSKQCFVLMPRKEEGTPESAHCLALFDVLERAVEEFGFKAYRTDDVNRPGSIAQDMLSALANADLVIANLTGLHPDVLFELGSRHDRCDGTLLIMDDREHAIPFHLASYRAIRFPNTVEGIEFLRRELHAYIEQLEGDPVEPRNVHDSSRQLREGDAATAADSIAAVKAPRSRALTQSFQASTGEVDVLQDALAEEKLGLNASTLVANADAAAKRGDCEEFLELADKVRKLRTSKPTTQQLLRLCRRASVLDRVSVEETLIKHAKKMYPTNRDIRLMDLSLRARSGDGSSSAQALHEMMALLGIRRTDSGYALTRLLAGFDFVVMGEMLDAFHGDDLHDEALGLLTALLEIHPNNPVIITNYARVLGQRGQSEESLSQHRKAMLLPDATHKSAFWMGEQLSLQGRFVDATEAYLCACRLDIDDAVNFIHFADALSMCTDQVGDADRRGLPCSLADAQRSIALAIQAALSIGYLSKENAQKGQDAAKRAEVDIESYGSVTSDYQPSRGSRIEREAFVQERLKIFGSALSDPSKSFVFTPISALEAGGDEVVSQPAEHIHLHPLAPLTANPGFAAT